jgi:hypothetical protein
MRSSTQYAKHTTKYEEKRGIRRKTIINTGVPRPRKGGGFMTLINTRLTHFFAIQEKEIEVLNSIRLLCA